MNTYAADSDFIQSAKIDSVTDKQKEMYDSVYGSDGWYLGSDGYLYVKDFTSNSLAYKLMERLTPSSGISANAAKMAEVFGKSQMKKDFSNWLHNNSSDMNLKNGILSIGKKAISAWGDVFRNNCVDVGSYRLITNNISNAELISEITFTTSGSAADKIQKEVLDKYSSYFVSSLDNYPFVINYFSYTASTSVVDYFGFWNSYSDDSSTQLVLYSYNGSAITKASNGYNYSVSSSGYVDYGSPNVSGAKYIYPNKYSYRYHGTPLKIFQSLTSAKYYYGILTSDSTPSVYYYNNYSPTDINVNLSTVKNTNYEQVFNNTYNTINEEKNTYITNNNSISEEELQKIIEKALEKYLSDSGDTGGDSGGGSSGGGSGSGGDSGGSSGGTTVDTSGIEKLLKSIEHFLDLIETHTGLTETRLELTNSVLSNTQKVIDAISETLTGQQDILKEIRDLLDVDSGKSIFDHLSDILDGILSEVLGNLLKDLVDYFIGDGGIVEAVTSPASALASTAQSKFPTSIPWDVIALIRIMSAEPQAPKINIPFKVERLGIDYTFKIDLEKADKVAELSRNMLTVTFLLYLTIQTRKLYGAMSKN